MRTRLKAVHGGVPCNAPRLLPVVDDAELTRALEETIKAADDDDVDVEKEYRPRQVGQWRVKCGEFSPAAFLSFRKVHWRERFDLDALTKSGGIVCETHETVFSRQVTSYHAAQLVDKFRPVLRAPLHANHINHERAFKLYPSLVNGKAPCVRTSRQMGKKRRAAYP